MGDLTMTLVIAEQRGGKLNRATWETIAAAQQAGGPVKIALLGAGADGVASELAAADVAEVIVVDAPALSEYTADGYVLALAALVFWRVSWRWWPARVFALPAERAGWRRRFRLAGLALMGCAGLASVLGAALSAR